MDDCLLLFGFRAFIFGTSCDFCHLTVSDQQSLVCHITIERLEPEQRLQIIELYYENNRFLKNAFRAL